MVSIMASPRHTGILAISGSQRVTSSAVCMSPQTTLNTRMPSAPSRRSARNADAAAIGDHPADARRHLGRRQRRDLAVDEQVGGRPVERAGESAAGIAAELAALGIGSLPSTAAALSAAPLA
jgi:hypothetical protein